MDITGPGTNSQALGINDNGAIVGAVGFDWAQGALYPVAWLYSNGVTTGDLGTLASPQGYSCHGVAAIAINDSGQITGSASSPVFCEEPSVTVDAYIFDGTSYAVGGPSWTDLGPGVGYAINASGQVTGFAYTVISVSSPPGCLCEMTDPVAALFSNGTVTLLPNGAGVGYAINASGLIVGDGVNGTSHAFIYNGITSDLNAFVLPSDPLQPYVTLTDARGINDNGLIVVNGIDSRTQAQHAYLLQVPLVQVNSTAFAVQALGTTSAAQSVTLTNVGTTPVALGNVSIASGPFAIQSNNCVGSLAPNTTCAISLTFAPTASGAPSAVVTVMANGSPVPITVSGVTPLVILSFTTSAPTLVASNTGSNLTINWTASNPAASCVSSGGEAGDGWSAGFTLPASGSRALTEVTAGTVTLGLTCTVGSQTATAQTTAVATWPIVTAALSASAPSVAPHQAVTLNWSSSRPAKSCVASGGGTGDGWANTILPTSGSKAVTEPTVPAAGQSTTLTFTVTCKPGVLHYAGTASVKVVQKGASASASTVGQSSGSSSGGGAFDSLSLAFLFAVFALQRVRRMPACGDSDVL
jgi:probable HAF family extracellular repeat protein